MAYSVHVRENGKVLSGFIAVLGLWMMAAPWILNYGYVSSALWNSLVVGAAVVLVAVARILLPNEFAHLSWINVAFGIWLILSPFIFGYGSDSITSVGNVNPAVGNHLVCGIFLTILAWLSATFNNPRLRG